MIRFANSAFLLSLILFSIVFSQQKNTSDKIITPEIISLSDITAKSELLEEQLNPILNQNEIENTNFPFANEDLKLMTDSIQTMNKNLKKDRFSEWNVRRLQNLKQEWINFQNIFSQWAEALLESGKKIGQEQNKIRNDFDTWELTKKNAVEKQAPKVILDRINFILQIIREATTILDNKNKIFLTQLLKIANQQKIISDVLSKIESSFKIKKIEVWSINELPLWQDSLFLSQDDNSGILQTIDSDWQILLFYFEKEIFLFIFLIIAWVLFLTFFLKLQKQDLGIVQDDDEIYLKIVTEFLKKPVDASFVLTFFMFIVFASNIPAILVEISTVLITIPLIRLVPAIISGKVKNQIYAMIGLYVFVSLDTYVAEFFLINSRFILLAISIFGATIIYRFYIIMGGSHDDSNSGFYKAIRILSLLAILFIVLGIIANIIGMMNLSRISVLAIIRSTAYFLMLYVILMVLNGSVALLLRRQHAQAIRSLKKRTKAIERKMMQLFGVFIAFLWFKATLTQFQVWDNAFSWFADAISATWVAGSVSISVGKILGFFLVIFITFIITKTIKLVLEEDILARVKLPRGAAGAISMISRYIIVGIGTMFALAVSGFELSKISFIVGALGVGIGFGLQNIISNFVSGLILAFERPIQAGDTVEVGNNQGVVKEIGVRASRIRTFEGTEVLIPNADLISKEVINWTLSDKLKRQELRIKVAIDSNPHEVKAILEKLCGEHAYILDDPLPSVLYQGFAEYSLDFRLLFWTLAENGLSTKSDLGLEIFDALRNAGIKIPILRHDVKLEAKEDPGKLSSSE